MRDTVLIVDDVRVNREILSEILEQDYLIMTAEDGKEALDILYENEQRIAVVLLDLVMPNVDGFAVLEVMKQKEYIKKIPVLIITAVNSIQAEKKCFDYEISDFILKPFDNSIVRKRVENVVSLFRYKNELEQTVEEQTDILKKQYKQLQDQAERLRKTNIGIIDVLGAVVEYRDYDSGEHIDRVKEYTRVLAERVAKEFPEYGLTPERIDVITSASALHDVGKIMVPDEILLKPGKLTKEEFAIMKKHSAKGAEILQGVENLWDEEYHRTSYEICKYHHERYDGKGYPEGLAGDDIPISAQIVSVADVYDALVNERVYKAAFSKSEAFRMIVDGECGVFSPKILKCFTKERKTFEKIASGQR